MKRVLTACLPVILAACGAGSEDAEQSGERVDSQSQTQVGQLADISQPIRVSAGSQYDLLPRLEAALAGALPGGSAADQAGAAVKLTMGTAFGDPAYSVDTVFGGSASDWAKQQLDKTASFGLMGVLNEAVAKRLCMISYWTESAGSVFEPTGVQQTIGIGSEDLSGKAGVALQGFCPALTGDDMAMLSASAPLTIWYEVGDLAGQDGSHYERVLRYQIAGSANNGQDGYAMSAAFYHTNSANDLKFLLAEQSDQGDSVYVAVNQDSSRELMALEARQMTGGESAARQAIYRLRLDGLNDEAATLLHAHEAAGYPATDLAVLLTAKALSGGQLAVSIGANGLNPLRDAFACVDRETLQVSGSGGTSGVCDGAVAASASSWFEIGKPLMTFDPGPVQALDETALVDFASLDDMLRSAPVTAQVAPAL